MNLRATSSGIKSASTQITTNPSFLVGIDVAPPTIGQTTVVVYDSENSTTSGKLVLAEVYMDAGLQGLNHVYTIPITANRGLYVTLQGTATDFIIQYAIG